MSTNTLATNDAPQPRVSVWSSLSMFYVKNGQIPEAEAAGGKARILSWGGKIRKDAETLGRGDAEKKA